MGKRYDKENYNHVKRITIDPYGTTIEIAIIDGVYFLIRPDGTRRQLGKEYVRLIERRRFEELVERLGYNLKEGRREY